MPRSRGSEMPQRQSPRIPLHLKTTACSESNGVLRHSVNRSPKLDDCRSPRSPLHEKKRGTRVADLETKLSQTQEELKKLKEQLASAEAAKKDAQQELDETKKLIPAPAVPSLPNPEEEEEHNLLPQKEATTEEKTNLPVEESINSPATDVFEVVLPAPIPSEPVPPSTIEADSNKKEEEAVVEKEVETKTVIEEEGTDEVTAEENEEEEFPNSSEISELTAKLVEKDKELEILAAENKSLKKHLEEAKENGEASRAKAEEIGVKFGKAEEELRESKAKAERLGEELEVAEGVKAALEAEMKRLRVQTEQWRKAAEAAAAVLSAGEEGNGRMVAERCKSMDKHLGRYGSRGSAGSPVMAGGEVEDELGGGKRRGGGGMRMFGELWKKKGQQQK